jgi:hypothetical protein
MAYFIFAKDSDNVENIISRIAENQNDLNNLNIIPSDYKIIEDSQTNFDLVKYGQKIPKKYNGNIITYEDISYNGIFLKKETLSPYVEMYINQIKQFLDVNKNHPSFNMWNNYYSQLKNLNLNIITYPLGKSLEQYFKDQGQPSLSPLQLP